MNRVFVLLAWLGCALIFTVQAMDKNRVSQFKQWQKVQLADRLITTKKLSTESVLSSYSVDDEQLRILLLKETEGIVVSIPLPNGKLADFTLKQSSVMATALANTYPDIKTFTGTQVDNIHNTGRFDITPNGFHGMFYYQGELVFIEPETVLVTTFNTSSDNGTKASKVSNKSTKRDFAASKFYRSYFGRKIQLTEQSSFQFHQPKQLIQNQQFSLAGEEQNLVSKDAKSAASTSAIKTYRLAISAAAEYTQFNGGTVDSAMAEMVTLVNRLNEVYQRDLAVKLELVANNNLLIFTDAATDPFANNSDDGEVNTQVIDDIIGSANYDIGHVVGTGGGGLAVLGAVCNSFYKGDGVTGSSTPNNDVFYIDYVAHEIGHQFGAEHTFNGTGGACSGNRVSNSAYEVGSGATIMSYAGLCGSENLQSHSDAFFHTRSIEQMSSFINSGNGGSCGVITGTVNNTAIVDAGADYVIPARTPFMLTGSATDVDNDTLTYSWQQFDLGLASSSLADQVDDGTRPLFRAWTPVTESYRVFPKLDDILANTSTIGEVLPTTDRKLNFRLLVRDGQGGVSFDETELTVVDTGEAFAVTAPLTNDTWLTNNPTVTWQVAGTDITPINCASVDILLSTDGGNSFTQTLAENIANNGQYQLSLSNNACSHGIATTMARVKVACDDNIFFAINESDFTIDQQLSASDIAINSQQTLAINQGESITLSSDMFTYACQIPSSFTIESGENYSILENTITPDNTFIGELSVGIITHKDGMSSDTYIATITVNEVVAPEPEPAENSSSSGSVSWLLMALLFVVWRNIQVAREV